MNLISGNPYYLLINSSPQRYQQLERSISTDILILGGGISGALSAYFLSRHDIACTVLDKRRIGQGSTCTSTSLLQYEIDVPLYKLKEKIGGSSAIETYHLSLHGLNLIKDLCKSTAFSDLSTCRSLYFSGGNSNIDLQKEFEARTAVGFGVEFLSSENILQQYNLHASNGILSEDAAKTDAYALTHHLHALSMKKGAQVFEDVFVDSIEEDHTGIIAYCRNGIHVRAKKIIYATGYEAASYLPKGLITLSTTYAFASTEIKELPDSFSDTLFWNTSDPYLYVREDHKRLLIGGRDEDFYDPEKRARLLNSKTKSLVRDFESVFPGYQPKPEFAWAGTFTTTEDGLPYIGNLHNSSKSFYALGYGGNGITFSALAAEMIAETIAGGKNIIPDIFSFNR